VGLCAELSPAVRAQADCPERVGYFEIQLEDLLACLGTPRPIAYRQPSRFQRVEREFTWVCPEELAFGELSAASRAAAGDLCAGVSLITIYRGQPYPVGQKAVSLMVSLQSDERTLEDKDINQAAERIVARVQADTGASLRRGAG
ncbi:MAG: hypothetical protein H0V44_07865, partial [Planctomycetes bacterium]|nr:hypothetical protein [Planctomycetota bacterium]